MCSRALEITPRFFSRAVMLCMLLAAKTTLAISTCLVVLPYTVPVVRLEVVVIVCFTFLFAS
jgi:hypothetical protein